MTAVRSPSPDAGERLGDYLRRSRRAGGWSQDELVRRTGLSLSTIRKMEDGRTPNPGVFTLLAVWKVLNLPPEALTKLTPHGAQPTRAKIEGAPA